MSIRPAAYDDTDDMLRLYVDGWRESYDTLLSNDFLATLENNPRSREYLQGLLAPTRKDAVVFLAERDNKVVGFIAAGCSRDIIDPTLAEVYAIYVDTAYQQKKIGGQLFVRCFTELQKKGFKQLHVWTFAENQQAHQAYQRWGGAISDKRRSVVVGGTQLEEVGFMWTF